MMTVSDYNNRTFQTYLLIPIIIAREGLSVKRISANFADILEIFCNLLNIMFFGLE